MKPTILHYQNITPAKLKANNKNDTHINPKSTGSMKVSRNANVFLSPSKSPSKSSPLSKKSLHESLPFVKAQNNAKIDHNIPLIEKPDSKQRCPSPGTDKGGLNKSLMNEFTEFKVEKELEIRSLKTQLKELGHLKNETAIMEEKKTLLMNKVEEFSKDFVTFKEEHSNFVISIAELKASITSLESEKQSMIVKNNELENEIERLTSKYTQALENANLWKVQNNQLVTSNNELERQVAKLEDELTLANRLLSQKENQIEELQNKESQLKENTELIEQLQEQVNELNEERIESKAQKSTLEEKVRLLLDEKATITGRIKLLEEAQNSSEEMVEKYKSSSSYQGDRASKAEEENAAFKKQILILKESEENLNSLILAQSEEIQSLRDKNLETLDNGKKEHDEGTNEANKNVHILEERNKELKEELNKALSDANNYKLKLKMLSRSLKSKGQDSNENTGSGVKPNVLQPSNTSSLDNKQNRIAKLSKKLNKKKKKSIGGYEIKSATS